MTVSPVSRAGAGGGSAKKGRKKAGSNSKNKAIAAAAAIADAGAADMPNTPAAFRPGYDQLEEDETLQYDPTAYDCMHSLALEWPCLSFDVLRDAATAARVSSAATAATATKTSSTSTTAAAAAAVASFPHTLFLAAGTQAGTRSANSLSLLRLGRVGRGKHGPAALRGADSDDDGLSSDSDDDEGDRPTLAVRRVAVGAGVNRVRAMPQHPGIVAAWLDSGVVSIWDLRQQLGELERMTDAESAREEEKEKKRMSSSGVGAKRRAAGTGASSSSSSTFLSLAPVASHRHGAEGFALAWSPGPAPGRLASGDCGGGLRVWEPREGAAAGSDSASSSSSSLSWAVSQPFGGHEDPRASVEDVAWSPTEGTVFATAATDAALRVFDARARSRPQLVVPSAHSSDVNVISWSSLATFMLASGGDDGAVKAWDLRAVGNGGGGGAGAKKTAAAATSQGEVARLCYHRGAVTSVEWSPTESSVLLSTGDATDGTTCVWDLAVERDPEEEAALGAGAAVASAAGDASDALPAQLLFVHAGQSDVKEAHWHPQIDGLVASTAADGFNVWRAANV